MTHRAAQQEQVSQRSRLFNIDVLPHWAMLILFLTWLYFQVTLGSSDVPGTLNQAFGAISGLWFAYLIRPKEK